MTEPAHGLSLCTKTAASGAVAVVSGTTLYSLVASLPSPCLVQEGLARFVSSVQSSLTDVRACPTNGP